jgi:hypothetical protein
MLDALWPATTMTASTNGLSAAIAAESKVAPFEDEFSAAGGQGSRAFSWPIREEAPAERTTAQMRYELLMGTFITSS